MVWLVFVDYLLALYSPAKSYNRLTGVTKTGNDEHALRVYSTYADLMAQSQYLERAIRYPHLVSFIGQTSMNTSITLFLSIV